MTMRNPGHCSQSRTYPPLAHRAATVRGTWLRGQGADKSGCGYNGTLRKLRWACPLDFGAKTKALKLPTFLREYDKQARQCAAEGVDHVRYLVRLTELELIDRERRMVERRIRMAKFPAVKSLDSFDFKAMPSLNKMMSRTRFPWTQNWLNQSVQGGPEHDR